MAFTTHPTVVPGDTWTASNQNTYIKDNFDALWVGTTRGDIDFYSSATSKSRLPLTAGGILYGGSLDPAWLAKPSALSILQHNATTPSWLAIGAIPGLLHAKATVDYNASDQVISSSTFADITGATVNIVTTRTCTIRMIGTGTIAAGGGGQRALVQGVIGGTGSGDTVHTSMTVYVPFTVVYYRTGVSAGTITCKLQGRGNTAGNSGIFHEGRIVVEAFVE
jgi:hypothetical protein